MMIGEAAKRAGLQSRGRRALRVSQDLFAPGLVSSHWKRVATPKLADLDELRARLVDLRSALVRLFKSASRRSCRPNGFGAALPETVEPV